MPRHAPLQHNATEHDAAGLMALYTAVADRWRLSVDERCALLGDVARSTHYEWTGKNPPRTLTTDQRARIALLVAIDLHVLHLGRIGGRLVRRPAGAGDA